MAEKDKKNKYLALFKERGACDDALEFVATQNSFEEALDNCIRPDWLLWFIVFKLDIDKKDHAKYFVEFGKTLIPFEKSIRSVNKRTVDAAKKFSTAPTLENRKLAEEAFNEWDNSASVRKSIQLAGEDEAVKKIWAKLYRKLRIKYKI